MKSTLRELCGKVILKGRAVRLLSARFMVVTVLIAAFSKHIHCGINEWTPIGLAPENVVVVAPHPSDTDVIYVGAIAIFSDTLRKGGLFKTTDHGLTWDTLGFRQENVNDIKLDPAHPETVWVAAGHLGIFRSTDGGISWSARNNGLFLGGVDNYQTIAIGISPADPNVLVCSGSGDMGPGYTSRTVNAGEQWSYIETFKSFYKIIFDTVSPGWVFASGWNTETPHVSFNNGLTFQRVGENDDARDVARNPFQRDWLWTIGRRTFSYSTDWGETWVVPDSSFPDTATSGQFVIASTEGENVLYAATLGRVHRTTTGGRAWIDLLTGWPEGRTYVESMTVVNNIPCEIWAGLNQRGLVSYTVSDTSSVSHHSNIFSFTEALLKVSPNPAQDAIYLSSTMNDGMLSVFNILGQVVFSFPVLQRFASQKIALPGSLPTGSYYLQFKPEAKTAKVQTGFLIIIR
jgi:hypothetical protein